MGDRPLIALHPDVAQLVDDARGSTHSRAGFVNDLLRTALAPKSRKRSTARKESSAGDPACRHPIGRRIGNACAACGAIGL